MAWINIFSMWLRTVTLLGYGDANANEQTHCSFKKCTCCQVTYNVGCKNTYITISGNTNKSRVVTDFFDPKYIFNFAPNNALL